MVCQLSRHSVVFGKPRNFVFGEPRNPYLFGTQVTGTFLETVISRQEIQNFCHNRNSLFDVLLIPILFRGKKSICFNIILSPMACQLPFHSSRVVSSFSLPGLGSGRSSVTFILFLLAQLTWSVRECNQSLA